MTDADYGQTRPIFLEDFSYEILPGAEFSRGFEDNSSSNLAESLNYDKLMIQNCRWEEIPPVGQLVDVAKTILRVPSIGLTSSAKVSQRHYL